MAGTPRKLICVWGSAVSVPGAGETSTGTDASLALVFSGSDRHAGAAALDAAEAAEADGPAPGLPIRSPRRPGRRSRPTPGTPGANVGAAR